MGTRSARRRALALGRRGGFAGVALLAACGGGGEIRLPTATIAQFKSACSSAGFSDEQCTCFVDELSQAGASDALFLDAQEAMKGGKGNLPPELEDAQVACPPPPVSSPPST